MVSKQNLMVWAWDARPYPGFPALTDVWADGENYKTGHWINGRMGAAPLENLVAAVLDYYGFASYDVSRIHGVIDGFVIDRAMSARQALDALTSLFSFDAVETQGQIKFRRRDEQAVKTIDTQFLVETKPHAQPYELTRAQETDLPDRLQILFIDGADNYCQASVDVKKQTGSSAREILLQAPVTMSRGLAQRQAAISLYETWSAREKISFSLPAGFMEIEVGDTIKIPIGEGLRTYRINEIVDGEARVMSASQIDIDDYNFTENDEQTLSASAPPDFTQPFKVMLDLPMLNGEMNPYAPWIATRASPWPGQLALLEETGGGYQRIGDIDASSLLGELITPLPAGPIARLDYATKIQLKVFDGELSSISLSALLSGGNAMAIGDEDSGWEIIQFQFANLISEGIWELTTLLRGQLGSDRNMKALRPAGSKCILLNAALMQIPAQASDIGRARILRLGPSGLDHGHPSFVEFTTHASGLALVPLSPVHLNARQKDDHLALSWIRRTRFDGDSWALNDIPLGEESENYIVEIMDGAPPNNNVVRTVQTQQSYFEYTTPQRQVDFGQTLPLTLTFRVAQISQTFGAGTFIERTINV